MFIIERINALRQSRRYRLGAESGIPPRLVRQAHNDTRDALRTMYLLGFPIFRTQFVFILERTRIGAFPDGETRYCCGSSRNNDQADVDEADINLGSIRAFLASDRNPGNLTLEQELRKTIIHELAHSAYRAHHGDSTDPFIPPANSRQDYLQRESERFAFDLETRLA